MLNCWWTINFLKPKFTIIIFFKNSGIPVHCVVVIILTFYASTINRKKDHRDEHVFAKLLIFTYNNNALKTKQSLIKHNTQFVRLNSITKTLKSDNQITKFLGKIISRPCLCVGVFPSISSLLFVLLLLLTAAKTINCIHL